MSKEYIFRNIYLNIFLLFINTSTSDAFFKGLFIPPNIISLLRLVLNFMFLLILIYYFLTRRIRVKKYIMTIIFIVFSGMSILWTPDKFEAIKLYINISGAISYLVLFFIINKKSDSIKIVFNYCLLLIVCEIMSFTLLGRVGYMDGSGSNTLRGIHLSRSAMIIYLNFCLFIFLYYLMNEKKLKYKEKLKTIIFIVLSVILIVISKSSTGLITVMLLIPLLLFFNGKRRDKIVLKVSILIAMLLPLMNITSSFLNNLIITIFGKTLTFSGRRYIWDYALENLVNNPIIGSGFDSTKYYLSGKVIPIYERVASHTHNGFLELFLQLGLVGVVLLIVIIFITYRYTIMYNKKESNLIRAYLVIFVIFNFMEPFMLNNVSLITLWLPLIFIITDNIKINKENINE